MTACRHTPQYPHYPCRHTPKILKEARRPTPFSMCPFMQLCRPFVCIKVVKVPWPFFVYQLIKVSRPFPLPLPPHHLAHLAHQRRRIAPEPALLHQTGGVTAPQPTPRAQPRCRVQPVSRHRLVSRRRVQGEPLHTPGGHDQGALLGYFCPTPENVKSAWETPRGSVRMRYTPSGRQGQNRKSVNIGSI